jgi:(p)ppGpp synthase/HD superfamily hydrolase
VSKLTIARELAKLFHAEQKYGERNYFGYHLYGVYRNVMSKLAADLLPDDVDEEDALCVAYLHDILEDTYCEIGTIINIFGYTIGDAVNAITKRKGTKRSDYFYAVKKNPLACFVKICDAEFNRDSCLYQGDEERAKYYQDTIDYLQGE